MTNSSSRDAATPRLRADVALWAMALGMGVLGMAIHWWFVREWIAVSSPVTVPWWVLAAAFAVAEGAVIHLQIRSDSHSLSLTEIPMVIGLVLAGPGALIAGRLVGSAAALTLVRRVGPMKLTWNLGLFYLETVAVLVVFRAVLGVGSPLDPVGWLAALSGILVMVVLGSAAVVGAISIHDPSRRLANSLRVVPMSAAISIVSALAGLLAVFALAVSPWTAPILVVWGGLLLVTLRSYGVLVRRHDDLRSLHEYVTSGADDDESDLVAEVLSGIGAATKAGSVGLLRVDGDSVSLQAADDLERVFAGDEWLATAMGALPPLVAAAPSDEVTIRIRGLGFEPALVVQLDPGESAAMLMVGPKLGHDPEYGEAERSLLETLAASAAARLRRWELLERLRDELAEKQEIIRSKDQLVASVSHELRTPMTSVLGFADLLQSNADLDESERMEMLQSIVDQALDITNIVDDLLTVARSDTGGLSIVRQAIDLMAEAEAVVSSRAAREVESVELIGDRTPAIADPHRVRQVLRNLVTNAARYGGGRVRVEIGARDDQAFIAVVDDGPGVPPGLVERIFEPYVRTRGSVSQPASVGLGLTISRRLAVLMGGDVTYERSNGETRFELTLPRHAADDLAA